MFEDSSGVRVRAHRTHVRARYGVLRWPAAAAVMMVVMSPQLVRAALSFSGDVVLSTGVPNAQALVGRESIGSVQLDNGSTFSSGTTQIGVGQNGVGFATVLGPRSTWTMGSADVGLNGVGTLDIQAGGIDTVTSTMRIGPNVSGYGTVNVAGAGSTLQLNGLTVGGPSSGVGTLKISDDAIVNANLGSTAIGAQGRVVLDGGLLRSSNISTISGLISGSGEWNIFTGPTMSFAGTLAVGHGDVFRITGAQSGIFESRGLIDIDGGELETLRGVNNLLVGTTARGEITLRNGTMRISTTPTNNPSQLKNSGLLAAIGGENHFYGTVSNVGVGESRGSGGKIAVSNHSTMIFHDDVTLSGGTMTVFPGSKATILEDLMMSSSALLLADIAGSSIDTEYGEIEVLGNIALGGTLQVVLSDGFTPEAGDSFQILKSYGGIEGSLELDAMPALPGRLMWNLDVTPNQVLLNVVTAPVGDFNRDGVVDSGDYLIWRKSAGASGSGMAADANGDGRVDDADHAMWKANFGATAAAGGGSSSALSTSVPEPAALSLLLAGMLMAVPRLSSRAVVRRIRA